MGKNKEQLIKFACQGDKQALEKLLLIVNPILNDSRDEHAQLQKILRMLCKLPYGSYIEK